jgi:hypothetical protein
VPRGQHPLRCAQGLGATFSALCGLAACSR